MSKSPKSKGKGSKKGSKGSNTPPVEEEWHYVRPPTPPPPPNPPMPTFLSKMRRQVWYPYANRATFKHKELSWAPMCPLCTSWGDIWVTDPQQRRILRYKFDPVISKLTQLMPPLITRGEPRMMIEIPRTGRIAVLLHCPTAKNTALVYYNPLDFTVEQKVEFPFNAKDPAEIPHALPPESSDSDDGSKGNGSKGKGSKGKGSKGKGSTSKSTKNNNAKGSKESKGKGSKGSKGKGSKGKGSTQEDIPNPYRFDLIDEVTPTGICANCEFIVVLFNPLQRTQIYHVNSLKPVEYTLENYYPDERTCQHLATSGGCALTNCQLYVAATRPARVQVFNIHIHRLYDRVDKLRLSLFCEVGLDRIAFGEPFCIQIDYLGLMVVNDSKAGFFHVYNLNKRTKGPWFPSLPHGETCFMGSWKIDPYQLIRPGYFSLGRNGTACVVDRWENTIHLITDRTELRWYDDTYLYLEDIPCLRTVVDPLMLPECLPPLRPEKEYLCQCKDDEPEPPTEEMLLPEKWKEYYLRSKDIPVDPPSKGKGSKGSKKGSKGSQKGSKKGTKGKK